MAAPTINDTTAFSRYSTAEEVTEGIDASDRTAIVTGASSGIGAETARVLALRGAQVVLAVRNVAAGERTKESILQEIPHARLHVLHLELSSMASVRSFCQNFKALNLPLNILINNAAIMACPFKLSADGLEMQFATNHIGHFLLTSLLLDDLRKAADDTGIQGRVVNVSSRAHFFFTYPRGIRFDQLNDDESSYDPWCAYGQSKLANILHAKELARRLQKKGVNVVANALTPGAILSTNLFANVPKDEMQQKLKDIGNSLSIFNKSIPQGAATQCLLAFHPSIDTRTGRYFADCQEEKPSDISDDSKLAKDLWDFSVKITSLTEY